MASINKQSVREEFEKIKASFQEQVSAGKVSSETATLFNTLILLFGIILSVFMEKTTKKTSANSGIPPSQTGPDDSATTDKKNMGKKKGREEQVTLAGNTRTIETVTLLPVLVCEKCGQDLDEIPCECIERRTKIDIIFEKTEEHMDAEVKCCPGCNTVVKASFPDDMPGPLQYGNGIKAYVIQLLVAQMVALNRVASQVAALIW